MASGLERRTLVPSRVGIVQITSIISIIAVSSFAVVTRIFMSTNSYSGRDTPPRFGDYEAQRNWMSLTLHAPLSTWYTRSEDYWRLDYPPGSAYQSLMSGMIVRLFHAESVGEPLASRGVEDVRGKVGMRVSVLVGDLVVYLPGCLLYWWLYLRRGGTSGPEREADGRSASRVGGLGRARGQRQRQQQQQQQKQQQRHDGDVFESAPPGVANTNTIDNPEDGPLASLFWLLVNPALLLIDHGHFQYNSISLGCTVLATACVLQIGSGSRAPAVSTRAPAVSWLVGAAFFFCMALNHKQMTLYYAPAFFVHLLTLSLCEEAVLDKVRVFGTLGLTVVGTFALLWAPFGVNNPGGARRILARIFPVQRGLYEDYVANFWCVSSLVYKWRRTWDKGVLAGLCLVATVGACVPSLGLGVVGVRRKQRGTFVLMLAGVSLSFYLFSFQVHEKSILMPLMAISMLGENRLTARMQSVGMMTMYPLLKKDGLVVAYWAMQGLVAVVGGLDWPLHSVLVLVHCIGAFVRVESKPFLEDAVMMTAGFLFYVWVWFWLILRMRWVVSRRTAV